MATDAMQSIPRPMIGPRGMVLPTIIALGLAVGITAILGPQSLSSLLALGKPWPIQTALGAALGLLFAGPLVVLTQRVPWFDPFHRQMLELLNRADLTGFNPLWISLCAGVGEEILFRGALQPLLGLWLTSLLFTALHFQTGGFRTMNPMKAVYALMVLLASLLLGTVFIRIGLIAAIVTHTAADVITLTALRSARR